MESNENVSRKLQLRRRIEFVLCNAQHGDWNPRRQSRLPQQRIVLERHHDRIRLQLQHDIELHVLSRQRHRCGAH